MVPLNIVRMVKIWKGDVERLGLHEVRKYPGWRDHALRGEWQRHRSVRLGIKWRLIYRVEENELYVEVVSVNPHDYR